MRPAFPFVLNSTDVESGTGAGRDREFVRRLPTAIVKVVGSEAQRVSAQAILARFVSGEADHLEFKARSGNHPRGVIDEAPVASVAGRIRDAFALILVE